MYNLLYKLTSWTKSQAYYKIIRNYDHNYAISSHFPQATSTFNTVCCIKTSCIFRELSIFQELRSINKTLAYLELCAISALYIGTALHQLYALRVSMASSKWLELKLCSKVTELDLRVLHPYRMQQWYSHLSNWKYSHADRNAHVPMTNVRL